MVVLRNRALKTFLTIGALIACGTARSNDVVLLDFSSAACAPCQEMRPVVQRLAAAGYRIRHVDIAREAALAAQFNVDQVPTFVSLVDGREYARLVGTGTYEELQKILAPRDEVRGQSPDPLPVNENTEFSSVANNVAEASTYAPLDTPQGVNPFGSPPQTQPFSGSTSTPATPSAHHARLLEATVKISVEDSNGNSAGTGTIVDARDDAALLLTCGHLFRESAGKGPISVTFFQATPAGAVERETAVGQLLNYDLERDLALVVVRPSSAVKAQPVAPANTPLAPGASVTTVGCNGGDNPTVIDTQITTIDRYQGPPNVEVAGAPVEGRSGGGLFNSAGQLIGVCFAADPQSNEGLYASLTSIQQKLDSLNLAMVYQTPSTETAAAQTATSNPVANPAPMAPPTEFASVAQPPVAVRGQDAFADPSVELANAAIRSEGGQPLSSSEKAALEEIQRRGLKSEVICIIRPHDPSGKSEVITLNNVSAEFVGALAKPDSSSGRSPATAAAGQLLR